MGSAHDGRLQKRTRYRLLHRVESLVVALSGTDSDMGDALVRHDRLHVREIQIDQGRQIDKIRNSLHRLLQHLVRLLQSVRHGRPAVYDLQQLVVGDHNQGIHALLQLLDTGQRVIHAGLGLELKGLRHHAYRQDSHILGKTGHHRRSAGSRAAAHAAGHEHHVRALNGFLDLLNALLGSLLANLRLGSCSQTLGQLLADLDGPLCLAQLQGLPVRIDPDKFYSANLLIYHAVHGVVPGAADSNHDNSRRRFRIVHHNFKQDFALLSLSCLSEIFSIIPYLRNFLIQYMITFFP